MPLRIFISYTQKDKSLTREKLLDLKKQLLSVSDVETYIDLFDNNNLANPQGEVIEQLMRSNIVWIINSNEITQSEWAMKEIDLARQKQKTTHLISIDLLTRMLNAPIIELIDLVVQYTQDNLDP